MKDLNRVVNRYIVLRMNRFAQVVNRLKPNFMFDGVLNMPLKSDIREQIKSFLKALLGWNVVNKYFSTVA